MEDWWRCRFFFSDKSLDVRSWYGRRMPTEGTSKSGDSGAIPPSPETSRQRSASHLSANQERDAPVFSADTASSEGRDPHRMRNRTHSDGKKCAPNCEATSPIAVDRKESLLTLKREMGLLSSVSLLIGTLIGTGIFLTPGEVLRSTRTPGLSLVIWTIAGVSGIIGGLCNAELGTLLPVSGGDYASFVAAGKPYGMYGDVPAFLYSWCALLMMFPTGMAVEGLTFSAYALSLPYGNCSVPYGVSVLVAVLYIKNLFSPSVCTIRWSFLGNYRV